MEDKEERIILLEEKIKILESKGYIKITKEYLEKLKAEDNELYIRVTKYVKRLKVRGKEVILLILYDDGARERLSISGYMKEFIEERSVEEIIEGTRKFLSGFDIDFK